MRGWSVRYVRCLKCGHKQVSVFPEDVEFASLECSECGNIGMVAEEQDESNG